MQTHTHTAGFVLLELQTEQLEECTDAHLDHYYLSAEMHIKSRS